jgi:DNA-binding transcriptional LysR family regulator
MADIRSVDFNSLVTFDAVYDERSTTRAAHRLAVTQPTVSGTLARLRALFEDPLFVRKQGGMVPTPRAEHLAPRIKRLIVEMQEALAPEQFDPETATFTTFISAADYGQTVLLLPLIERLRREAPRIRIAVMPFEINELAEKFRRGQIDIAITIPELAPPDYPSRSLFSDRYVGVVRDSHPVTTDRVDLDSFCNFPHILVSPTGGSFESATDEVLRQIGRRRDVVVSVPNFRFALDLVQCDDFIVVLPEQLISRHDHTARKVELPFEIKGPDAIIVWHPRLHDDPAHKWLRDQIVQMAGDD